MPLESTIEPGAFRAACAQFTTGVAIATVRAASGEPHGLTVSSFTSVSIDPPLILVCLDYGCAILSHFRENRNFGINILSESQQELAVLFSATLEGRFEGIDWNEGSLGSPLFPGALAYLECTVERIVEAGDHAIFIGQVQIAQAHQRQTQGKPLLYFDRSYRSLL